MIFENNVCFDKLVGITRGKCDCLTDKPKDWNKSISGQFLDDPTYGVPISKNKVCWDNLADMYKDSVQQAKMLFRTNLKSPNVNTFNGVIGNRPRNATNYTTNRYVGIVIGPNKLSKGLVLRLKSLKFSVDVPGTYNVYIQTVREIQQGNILGTDFKFIISSDGDETDTYVNVDTIDLPLSCLDDCQSWAIVLDLEEIDSKVQANPVRYDYWAGCQSCGGKDRPKWWDKEIKSGGFDVSDITTINDYCNSKLTGSLQVNFEVVCDAFNWICDMDYFWWQNDVFAYNFALGIKMLWALAYLDKCESNPDYFDNTSLKSTNWLTLHKQRLTLYVYGNEDHEGHFQAMARRESIPKNISDCWTCKSSMDYVTKRI